VVLLIHPHASTSGHWTARNNELLIWFPRLYLGTGEQSPGFVLWILLLWAPFPVVFLLCGPSSRDRPWRILAVAGVTVYYNNSYRVSPRWTKFRALRNSTRMKFHDYGHTHRLALHPRAQLTHSIYVEGGQRTALISANSNESRGISVHLCEFWRSQSDTCWCD
jgi:hypothetical protein